MPGYFVRHKDCQVSLSVVTSPAGFPVGVLTADGAGVSDDVARCLETLSAEMGADFLALTRYVIDIRDYAGRFSVSGLRDQAALFAARGVTDLRVCYLMGDQSFDQTRALLKELYASKDVALAVTCRPVMAQALAWLDQS